MECIPRYSNVYVRPSWIDPPEYGGQHSQRKGSSDEHVACKNRILLSDVIVIVTPGLRWLCDSLVYNDSDTSDRSRLVPERYMGGRMPHPRRISPTRRVATRSGFRMRELPTVFVCESFLYSTVFGRINITGMMYSCLGSSREACPSSGVEQGEQPVKPAITPTPAVAKN